MKHPEQDLVHRPTVKYLINQYPHVFFHHSPNGGWRKKVEAAIFVGLGVKKGFPDLLIYEPRENYCGLVIEFKAPGRIKLLTDNQKTCLAILSKKGWYVSVVDSFEDSKQLIDEYLQKRNGFADRKVQ